MKYLRRRHACHSYKVINTYLHPLGVFCFPVDFGVFDVLDPGMPWTGVLGLPVDLGVLEECTLRIVLGVFIRHGEFSFGFGRRGNCCHLCRGGFDTSGSLVTLLISAMTT